MENIRRRYTSSDRAINYRQRSGVRQAKSDAKKRKSLGEILTRQISICIIIAAICLGVKGMENPQVQTVVDAVRGALFYDIDVGQSFEAMRATYDKVVGNDKENAEERGEEAIPAYTHIEPQTEGE